MIIKFLWKNEAKQILESRLRGEVDRGIAYMEKSSFGEQNTNAKRVFLNNGYPKIAMMLHCFYDAPHIYRHMIFEDFYEWVELVFSTIGDMNVDFIVKPHPNAKPYNKGIIEDLLVKHPHIRLIDKNTSNSQIISEGVELILTVYGTAAHEFSYQGINVLVAGDHPGAEYNFVHQPTNKTEFENCLRNPRDIKINIDKSEIEEFFTCITYILDSVESKEIMIFFLLGKGTLERLIQISLLSLLMMPSLENLIMHFLHMKKHLIR